MSAVPFGRPEQFPVCPICGRDVEFEDCSNCQGDGWTLGIGVESGHGCDGTDEVCAVTCPVPVQVQIQEECDECGGHGTFPWCPEHGVVHNYVFRKLIVLDGGKL